MKLWVVSQILTAVFIISVHGQAGQQVLIRTERQSPISMGMRMLDNFRGGVQRTFQGFMGRIMGRPRINRPSYLSPSYPQPSHHNTFPSRQIPHHPHFMMHAAKEEDPPPPVFKPATKSAFAVFHEGRAPATMSPVNDFHHIDFVHPAENSIISANHHSKDFVHAGENAIIPAKLQSNYILQGDQAQLINHGVHSDRNLYGIKTVEDRSADFKGSPLVDKYTSGTDGWRVISPPYPQPSPKSTYSDLKSTESYNNPTQQQYGTEQGDVKMTHEYRVPILHHNANENNIVVVKPPAGIDTSNYIENYSNLPTVTLKPFLRTKPYYRPKMPLVPSKYKFNNARPRSPQKHIMSQQYPTPPLTNNMSKKYFPKIPRNRYTPQKQHNRRTRPDPYGNLVGKGYKLEIGSISDKKGTNNRVYEFGYGSADKPSTMYYHAEKKKDESYNLERSDSRIQTAKYLDSSDGYPSDVSHEGISQNSAGESQQKQEANISIH